MFDDTARRAPLLRFWLLLMSVGATLVAPSAAFAWKPYTHVYAAREALKDALDDGKIEIRGRQYSVDPIVLAALSEEVPSFQSGVIGPDGFPDLTYGQSVIHPTDTGKWLRLLHRNAWSFWETAGNLPPIFREAAQEEARRSIAFAYGFLAHAAGDMWGHTFVNDFAQGVFPGIAEFAEIDKAEIAFRHLIVEGYVGDATPGFDGNPEFGPAPGPNCPQGNPLCDRSDDSTPGIAFEIPRLFIYQSLIADSAATPLPDRGPLIGFFKDMRTGLIGFKNSNFTKGLEDAVKDWGRTNSQYETLKKDCAFDDLSDAIFCPIAIGAMGLSVTADAGEAIFDAGRAVVAESLSHVLSGYINSWVDDIDRGLEAWPNLGLALSKALFDAQTRRNLQNTECTRHLAGTLARDDCEKGIGLTDTLSSSTDPFVNDHLLSMLGAPDAVGDVRKALDELTSRIDQIINALNLPFNPVRAARDTVRRFARDLIKDAIEDTLGVDLDALQSFTAAPGAWFLVDETGPALGSLLGFPGQSLKLFEHGEHDRADGYLVMPGGHHIPTGAPFPNFPVGATRLSDQATFDQAAFRALANTITMIKLLFLEESELNRLAGEVLVEAGFIDDASLVRTYGRDSDSPANIMFSSLQSSDPWLKSIDSDHGWRADGMPRFCNDGAPCPKEGVKDPIRRSPDLNGGTGHFPMWRSCALRPVFRRIFSDWEGADFPDYGDDPSSDPSDPTAPTPRATFSTNGIVANGVQIVPPGTRVRIDATDNFFKQSKIDVRARVLRSGASHVPFVPLRPGGELTIPSGDDGLWRAEYAASDPCSRNTGPASYLFAVDGTAPTVSFVEPALGAVYPIGTQLTLRFLVEEPLDGSGVASSEARIDGTWVSLDSPIDTFDLGPGMHTLVVSTIDRLGNTGTSALPFRVDATVDGLRNSLERLFATGGFDNEPLFRQVQANVAAAVAAHGAGDVTRARLELQRAFDALWTTYKAGCQERCGGVERGALRRLITTTVEVSLTLGRAVASPDAGRGPALILFDYVNNGFLQTLIGDAYRDLIEAVTPAAAASLDNYDRDVRAAAETFSGTLTRHLVECAKRTSCGLDRAYGQVLMNLLGALRPEGRIVFVVADGPRSVPDQLLADRLRGLGFAPQVLTDAEANADTTAGALAVIISESVRSAAVGTKLRNILSGVLSLERALVDEFGLAGGAWNVDQGATTGQQRIDVTDCNHPLAAGLCGAVSASFADGDFGWSVPATGVSAIAKIVQQPTRAAIVAAERGTVVGGSPLTGRRAGWFASADLPRSLTVEGWRLFDAAVRWTAARPALLVVGTASPLSPSDGVLARSLAEVGYAVRTLAASAYTPELGSGHDVIVISESVQSGDLAPKLGRLDAGLVVLEPALFDDLGMTGTGWQQDFGDAAAQTKLELLGNTGVLTAGRSGVVTLTTSPSKFVWGRPGSAAEHVARIPNTDRWGIFLYRQFSFLANGSLAPAPRIGWFAGSDTVAALNRDGLELLVNALRTAGRYD